MPIFKLCCNALFFNNVTTKMNYPNFFNIFFNVFLTEFCTAKKHLLKQPLLRPILLK